MATMMTEPEVRAFMLAGSRTAKLATVRADGRPHVAPVWFTFDDDTGDLVFLTGAESLKAANMAHEPRVSICVDDETFPFGYARVDGVATMVDDDPELLHWSTETCRRYVGDDRADEFGRRNAASGEVLVRVRLTRLVGATGISN